MQQELVLLLGLILVLSLPALAFEEPGLYGGQWPAGMDASEEARAFFPIGGWGELAGVGGRLTDEEGARLAVECGMTLVAPASVAQLEICQRHRLAALVWDPRCSEYDWLNVDPAQAEERIKSLAAETASNPWVLGYLLTDEPSTARFQGISVVAKAIAKYAPGKLIFVNLFPNYASPEQLGAASYEEYLTRFIAEVGPNVLSYDNYSMMDDGSIRAGYFANLDAFRRASLASGMPWCNVVLGNAHFSYAEPSPATTRLQAFTTLAAGGRGLVYFTFHDRLHGNYRDAAIDVFGHKTPTFDMLRNVNLKIRGLAPTINRLTSTGLYTFPEARDGLPGLEPEGGQVLKALHSGVPALVGEFRHEDGSRWAMIVNLDLVRSAPMGVEWTTGEGPGEWLCPYTGTLASFEGESVWLAPGQGVLLKAPGN